MSLFDLCRAYANNIAHTKRSMIVTTVSAIVFRFCESAGTRHLLVIAQLKLMAYTHQRHVGCKKIFRRGISFNPVVIELIDSVQLRRPQPLSNTRVPASFATCHSSLEPSNDVPYSQTGQLGPFSADDVMDQGAQRACACKRVRKRGSHWRRLTPILLPSACDGVGQGDQKVTVGAAWSCACGGAGAGACG